MLSDRQKEQLSAEMIPLFQELEQDIIQDIARRVRKEKRWTETAELQAKALEALGYKPMEIRNKVMRELKADKEYQAMIAKNTLEHKRAVRDRIKQLVVDAK
ncbi:MAG: phage minor capsid protein, partial [Mogibacterium sp.]|nr:phage minor capsid protein [Mogibacterium sp.]